MALGPPSVWHSSSVAVVWLGAHSGVVAGHELPRHGVSCRLVRLSQAQVVLFGQGGDGGEVDVELVAGDHLVDGGLVPLGRGQQRRHFTEVVLEAAGEISSSSRAGSSPAFQNA